MPLAENLKNRQWLVSRLRAEIVGPDPAGEAIDFQDGEQKRLSWEAFRKPKQQRSGEEILWQDPPTKRYGAGILYPMGVTDDLVSARDSEEQATPGTDVPADGAIEEKLEEQADKRPQISKLTADDSDDYDVTLANAFKPSAIGLSFLADFSSEDAALVVELICVGRLGSEELIEQPLGAYQQVSVWVGGPPDAGAVVERSLWLRSSLKTRTGAVPCVRFDRKQILTATRAIRVRVIDVDPDLEIVVVSRRWKASANVNCRLVTVSLVNKRKPDAGRLDSKCIFQSGLRARVEGKGVCILPYPEVGGGQGAVERLDVKILQLIYRQHQTFAIGHGCAADWKGSSPERVSEVWTDVLPAFETPTTSADLFVDTSDGGKQQIRVSMRKLAGLDRSDDGSLELGRLVDSYSAWVESLKGTRDGVPAVPEKFREPAEVLIHKCELCLARIRDGIAFLHSDTEFGRLARRAFALANHAMLIAQLRSSRDVRNPTIDDDGRILWVPTIKSPEPSIPDDKVGYWRAFQIAFLMMSLRGICDPESDDREMVELIWFPTGGGKTEAYLGLAAFTIFFNRVSGRDPGGADVLMRYTLRLLTAQQFQRAALLFCAMEHLRKQDRDSLGETPFRIGLWVGGSATPNTRQEARSALKRLESDADSENPFVLLKCPWCGSKFGPVDDGQSSRASKYRRGGKSALPSVFGYRRYKASPKEPETVVFRCGDPLCEFGERPLQKHNLPIAVIDEDLLDDPPNLLLGTVDKFAMLAWKPEARTIFGIGDDGRHKGLPPTLIIQDELHLISGPLGSMVGAYETVIERLCRVDGLGKAKPKIIASTATISRAAEQIRNLYAREGISIFPPSGLEAGDSFFARDARNDDGSPKPGRLYLGVLAPAHGSLQTTEARTFACVMQHAATMNTDDAGRDPWWTLICFFNSLRELGSAATLFVADARDYLRVTLDRQGIKYDKIRKLFNVTELTSRIRSDKIPKELERLERVFFTATHKGRGGPGESEAVDACLASNIIEVGVDVTRLALMAIVGQPKTTSQYIQVSSRIGRDPEKPGLVVVLYGQSKPRDRSHYERFRSYHQRLYAQVEPTSVTPFSPPAVDRALHAIIVAAVRQLGAIGADATRADPFPLSDGSPLRRLVDQMIDERVSIVAPEERLEVRRKLARRLDEWRVWSPVEYGGFGAPPQDPPLLHPAGRSEPPAWNGRSWPTMSSLRDVDATCEADITDAFHQLAEEDA